MRLIKKKLTIEQLEIQKKINLLTDDEDIRQVLWVCHLSGMPLNSLDNCLEKAILEEQKEKDKNFIYSLITSPISNIILNNFTELEKSVIFLLAMGHDIMYISRYKGITKVRVRRIINNIQSSKIWDSKWLLKDPSQKKRNLV